jgi:hypothetical protein
MNFNAPLNQSGLKPSQEPGDILKITLPPKKEKIEMHRMATLNSF